MHFSFISLFPSLFVIPNIRPIFSFFSNGIQPDILRITREEAKKRQAGDWSRFSNTIFVKDYVWIIGDSQERGLIWLEDNAFNLKIGRVVIGNQVFWLSARATTRKKLFLMLWFSNQAQPVSSYLRRTYVLSFPTSCLSVSFSPNSES